MNTIFSKQNRTLALLVALFLVPVVLAHYVFNHASDFVSKKGTNYGQFVNQKITWQAKSDSRPWQLVLMTNGECDTHCQNTLDQLSRLRLSMGRKLYDLDLILSFPPKQEPPAKLKAQLQSQNILWAALDEGDLNKWMPEVQVGMIILFGPEHQAILKYPNVFESKKMAHDLQLLIK